MEHATVTTTVSKTDVERFFLSKHINTCGVCGRFRSPGELDVRALSCNRLSCNDPLSEPLNVLMIVCQHCGAIEFHDHGVIARWLEDHRHS
jgi:hypothetical protein